MAGLKPKLTKHSVAHASGCGGVKRDDRAGVKDVGGRRGWSGVHTDFHFSPSAYVKMLSLSPSQVLPLQMPELSGLSDREGGREQQGGSLGTF